MASHECTARLRYLCLFPMQDKGDVVRIERSGLRDNWDDAEGYYSKYLTPLYNIELSQLCFTFFFWVVTC